MRPYLTGTTTRPRNTTTAYRAHFSPKQPSRPCRKTITHSTQRHLNILGGRENTKFDHLDKTKDLSATPPGKNRATLWFSCPWRLILARLPICRQSRTVIPRWRLTALTALTAHIFPPNNLPARTLATLPRIPRLPRIISPSRLRPRRQSRQQREHVPGGAEII
jgi:hypothetical protein